MNDRQKAALLLERVRNRLSGPEIEALELMAERGFSTVNWISGETPSGGRSSSKDDVLLRIFTEFADQLK